MLRFIDSRFVQRSAVLAIIVTASLAVRTVAAEPTAQETAAEVDRLLQGHFAESGTKPAPLTSDEDFLRRVTLDLSGTLPSPAELTLFGLNPDSDKRAKLVDQLLSEGEFAENWARYWRDVIFLRATDVRSRIAQPVFEQWMTDQLRQNRKWDQIATDLLTASGDVREVGATGLIFAQGGEAEELAAETSRIFLGIQIQCANCHDHPSDVWVRDDFHQLAAYFPRIRVRQVQDDNRRTFEVVSFNAPEGRAGRGQGLNLDFVMRRFDTNRDGKLTKEEAKNSPIGRPFDAILQRADANKDGALSAAELKNLPPPGQQGRGTSEHYMPDLTDPSSRGKRVDPVFFVSKTESKAGLSDEDRRAELATLLTSKDNPWFARAMVNRIWAELLGEGFYMPIDDIGPERTAAYPDVLEVLSSGFAASEYDVRWLFRTIVNTQAYQRQIRARPAGAETVPFAAASPTRLRSDQLYSAITDVLGATGNNNARQRRGGGAYGPPASARGQFAVLFGFDPSTPQADITGSVPQALFLMNSPQINNAIRGDGNTRLGRILQKYEDDNDALAELYVLVLSREPSAREIKIATDYIAETGNRREAFEDLMWSLLNSSEFLSKR